MNKRWKLKSNIKEALHFIISVFMYSIFSLLILIGVIIALYAIDLKKNAAKGVTKPPLYSAYVIVSQSMEPSIKVKDTVITKRLEPSEYKVGNVITFVSTDSRFYGITITHRIKEIIKLSDNKLAFRTKGDNNNAVDDTLVDEDHVIGKVIFKIPMLGYIQEFLTRSYGWIIAIVIPCLAIIIYDIIKLFKALGNRYNSKKNIDNNKNY